MVQYQTGWSLSSQIFNALTPIQAYHPPFPDDDDAWIGVETLESKKFFG